MKNIFKTLIPCLAVAFSVTSCYEDLGSKADVDSVYAQANTITATIGDATPASFSQIDATGSISAAEGVLEAGFMLSTAADFATYEAYPVEEVSTALSISITGLEEATTYYVRTYAYTANGTSVSEGKSVVTPVAPTFELVGTYTATDYSTDDDSSVGSYEVTIAFAEGSTTDILITNIWDGEETIKATYDATTGAIVIPAKQIINVHQSYGDVWLEDPNGAPVINGQFTAKGGFLNINPFNAICDAGSFGGQYVKMAHK